MGDNEGSSSAAQGAQAEDDDSQRGLLGRLINAITGPEPDTDPNEPRKSRAATTGLANLTQLSIEDVMVPKVEIVSLPIDTDKASVVDLFRESGLTRVPVYDGTLDSPKGLVHLKDFALKFGFDAERDDFDLSQMLRPLLYAPPSMPIGVLLQKMQTERKHMALVIDEYGGVDGLVTIEDLIETVIGEIEDEHDIAEGRYWSEESPGQYIAQARTPINEFEDETGLTLLPDGDDEEIDTLGGLVFMLAGRVPARGEIVPHPEGANFEVIDADPRRIKRLRVRLNGAEAAE